MKPEIELGAWIVAAHKVISKYDVDHPALDPFEAIIIGGRAADLFSATRSLGKIDSTKFDAHRKLARLKLFPVKEVLKSAERLGFVDVTWTRDPTRPVLNYRFKVNSKEAVLDATGSIFPYLNPTSIAKAALDVMRTTLYLPDAFDRVINELITKGYPQQDAETTLQLVTELGLVTRTQETDRGQTLLFNSYAFEGNAEETFKVIQGLNPAERQKALDILTHVRDHPGVPLPGAANTRLMKLLIKVGLIDYSEIRTARSTEGVYFPTAPYIWGVFDKSAGKQLSIDLIDDAKLLLNSFRYGQYFSYQGRGRIKDPEWIVNALLRDGVIGAKKPATAIGEDYPLALSRGIVNVVESRIYPGRYSMELMKRDVAQAVSEVLEQHTMLPSESVPTEAEVERAGQFISPGAVRVEIQLPPALKRYQDELIFGLRTMRRKR